MHLVVAYVCVFCFFSLCVNVRIGDAFDIKLYNLIRCGEPHPHVPCYGSKIEAAKKGVLFCWTCLPAAPAKSIYKKSPWWPMARNDYFYREGITCPSAVAWDEALKIEAKPGTVYNADPLLNQYLFKFDAAKGGATPVALEFEAKKGAEQPRHPIYEYYDTKAKKHYGGDGAGNWCAKTAKPAMAVCRYNLPECHPVPPPPGTGLHASSTALAKDEGAKVGTARDVQVSDFMADYYYDVEVESAKIRYERAIEDAQIQREMRLLRKEGKLARAHGKAQKRNRRLRRKQNRQHRYNTKIHN